MIVVDVETTGVYPEKHSIVSIGALDFNNPKNNFYEECRIWDGAEITEGALAINGFTREQIKDPLKSSLENTIKKFIDWARGIEDRTFAGENSKFDRDFLVSSAERCGLKLKGYRTVDLHSSSYCSHLEKGFKIPLKESRTDLNLDKTLKYVGLPEEPRPHNALTGAKMEAEAFSRLIYGRCLLDEFSKYEIPNYLKK